MTNLAHKCIHSLLLSGSFHLLLEIFPFFRSATLYVSMNNGLSFISSSVTITAITCVSIKETKLVQIIILWLDVNSKHQLRCGFSPNLDSYFSFTLV